MSNNVNILTPVGRIVQGSPFKPQDKDAEGKPLVVKSGPNAGQPRQSYFIALAVPKTDAKVGETIAAILSVAKADFPQFFNAQGQLTNPNFAIKITDGDSAVPNTRGIKPCDREGYKGCWVFKFNNGFAPKCFTAGGASIITDSSAIKTGYYVRVYATISGNGSIQQPGIYLNFSMVELIGYGPEIVVGPTGEVFGQTPAAIPAGVSQTPIAPATTIAQPTQLTAAQAFIGSIQSPGAYAGVSPIPSFLNPQATK